MKKDEKIKEEEIEAGDIDETLSVVEDENLKDFVKEMPDVVPEAVEAGQLEDKKDAEIQRDSKGNIFDQSQHAKDSEGKPLFTPTGRFQKIKRPKQNEPIITPAETLNNGNIKGCAITCVGMFIQTGVVIFGDEWKPIKEKDFNEQEHLIMATESYFKSAGVVNLPPWLVLVVAFGSYGLRRFEKPRTKSFLQKIGGYFGRMFSGIFNWFKKRKKLAHVDSRDNGNRKDDASVQDRPAV